MPEIRELFATETIPFSAPPPSLVVSGMKCDLKGNIYVVYSDAPQAVLSQKDAISRLPISRLSLESKTAVQYTIPFLPDVERVWRYDFDVDVRGKLYALLAVEYNNTNQDKPRSANLIVRYKDDGTMDTYFKIGDKPGEHIQPLHLTAFPDGNFLVSGTSVKSEGLGVFAAVFDRGGTFAADIEVPDDVEIVRFNKRPDSTDGTVQGEAAPTPPSNGAQEAGHGHPLARRQKRKAGAVDVASHVFTLSAPDGNIYMLRATDPLRLYVVAPSGQVVRESEIASPAPGLTPIHMGIAGDDKVFFQFAHVATGAPGENNQAAHVITVIDPQTGDVAAVYRLAAGESGSDLAACASSPYDFLFVGTSEDNKLKVVRYSPR